MQCFRFSLVLLLESVEDLVVEMSLFHVVRLSCLLQLEFPTFAQELLFLKFALDKFVFFE